MHRDSAQLRDKHRRVLTWSFGAAIFLHVAAFLLFSAKVKTIDTLEYSIHGEEAGLPPQDPWVLDVLFGAPTISVPDDTDWQEPPDRFLQAVRVVEFPAECVGVRRRELRQLEGRVHLRVNAGGHAAVVNLVDPTGSECGDGLIRDVAGDLHYHWLPNDQFPAPLDLVQPVTLAAH